MRISDRKFFLQDAEILAKKLIGKYICTPKGKFLITETEYYKGKKDSASHAYKGKIKRNKIMWEQGGNIYVYLCYGLYYMLNIVSGKTDEPQAILIRGIDHIFGPGKVGKFLEINLSFYGEDLTTSNRIWIEEGKAVKFKQFKRIGIDYANFKDKQKLWRFRIFDF